VGEEFEDDLPRKREGCPPRKLPKWKIPPPESGPYMAPFGRKYFKDREERRLFR